ncbi:uncharacterized protein ColSpa_10025 [Colletotrichum spaethianum]|uniref:Uncharacterized protein n=1 Tax=Colletotrichum spaethianum TaxID=700344 RepID=A0AA37UJL0_9PEZI|nr:uncharacterized protein ColSpa_10025 [Colletotrichum spaethianum]GKT49844.1 hypothetical protein ColSpa_10025 [Colletotrichum spaethianum]
MTRHHYHQDESSYDRSPSQDSQLSIGPDDTADEEHTAWTATRPAFEAWADDRMRRRCRWRCCRCRYVNRMPRSRLTVMHCRNPGLAVEGENCPRDRAGETHAGPGECCTILVPQGMESTSDGEWLD